MKIAILLPYKENFSSEYAGAVSIFINDTVIKSKYRYTTEVYGNTNFKKDLLKNYTNLSLNKKSLIESSSNLYVNDFIKKKNVINSDIIEIHNRPNYVNKILELKKPKKILYFHNNPLEMNGSKTIRQRLSLIDNLDQITFNSEWTKKQFLLNLPKIYTKIKKLSVVYQSTTKPKINLKKKEKIITFIGKLNSAKGYDVFGEASIKILNEFPDWKVEVIGDESREEINFNHNRFKLNGFQNHKTVLKILKKTSISVVCSRWDEPFGRTSLEASANGCAVIISNRGGLSETVTDSIILENLSSKNLYNEIKKLIDNRLLIKTLQSRSLRNFFLTHKYASDKIDNYRNEILKKKKINLIDDDILLDNLKILHITNFNERHDGRLFYNTGRRINNGFIYCVQELLH